MRIEFIKKLTGGEPLASCHGVLCQLQQRQISCGRVVPGLLYTAPNTQLNPRDGGLRAALSCQVTCGNLRPEPSLGKKCRQYSGSSRPCTAYGTDEVISSASSAAVNNHTAQTSHSGSRRAFWTRAGRYRRRHRRWRRAGAVNANAN